GTMQAGAKIRFTGPNNPLGVGLVAFYRFYTDKADDFSGFNQLQRGASPGGDIGDFGLVGFVSGRLSRSVSLHSNFGYILNSNPQSEAFGTGKVTLLDRPDEFVGGIGMDFVVNRHFQIITELKSVHYVGGRTPNSFENNPVDFLGGIRIFPRRWFGFSAAYRGHLNQQGQTFTDIFGDDEPNNGFPAGFQSSDDPHGFIFQAFFGRRNERLPTVFPNQPPTVSLSASSSRVVLAAECSGDQMPDPTCTPTSNTVQLSATATDPDGDTLLYTYSTTGGRVSGDGPNATLDLTGVAPGTYTVTVEVDDGCGCIAFTSTTVTVERCNCVLRPTPTPQPCPTVSVSCPSEPVRAGQPITFTANVSGGDSGVTPTFNWTVSAGTISTGQGTSSITVDTTGLPDNSSVTATVDVGGFDRSCQASNSCTTGVTARTSRKIDEYGNIRFNDEKARLDNFAIELQNDPTAQGYLVCYGGRRGRTGEAQRRCDRAKDYLVTTRGITSDRIVTVDGGFREDLTVELWIVPSGATPPQNTPTVDPSEVRATPAPTRRGRRRGRDDDEE
ncbi:MAG TPA: PKD domain-containing protein, partial [Pyrinomonadaceae bacterium]